MQCGVQMGSYTSDRPFPKDAGFLILGLRVHRLWSIRRLLNIEHASSRVPRAGLPSGEFSCSGFLISANLHLLGDEERLLRVGQIQYRCGEGCIHHGHALVHLHLTCTLVWQPGN